ncbi:MAG: hypothetical protein A3G75_05950 [Verrucomicrobia bacterium RIFCSPLOWO2_12_FULL_64_8]|nr:MAG: hypothetical protein A3G75_05950 [Verrucomicrobia bacterium RIFCSPLOWO2_12_FULL_64_8]
MIRPPILLFSAALLAAAAAAEKEPVQSRERSTDLTAAAPVEQFTVNQFTPEGYRLWLVRGAEGRIVRPGEQFDVTELHLTIFTGDATERVESILLSATATVLLREKVANGTGPVRLINYVDHFEVTGEDWTYDQTQKKVSIRKNVRVVFRTRFNDVL